MQSVPEVRQDVVTFQSIFLIIPTARLRVENSARCQASQQTHAPASLHIIIPRNRPTRKQASHIVCSVSQQSDAKVVIVKNTTGDMPFPWSDKDPYKLPVSIERVQKMLFKFGE